MVSALGREQEADLEGRPRVAGLRGLGPGQREQRLVEPSLLGEVVGAAQQGVDLRGVFGWRRRRELLGGRCRAGRPGDPGPPVARPRDLRVRRPVGVQVAGLDLDRRDPVLHVGVAEQVGRGLCHPLALLLAHELAEELRDAVGLVAGAGHEDAAQAIGLVLELAAPAQLDCHVRRLGGDHGRRVAHRDGRGHPAEPGEQVRHLGLPLHAGVVVGLHVGDLVAHHARQLVDVAGRQHGAAVEVDVAARHGEGVEAVVLDHAEAVDEGLGLEGADDLLAEVVDEARRSPGRRSRPRVRAARGRTRGRARARRPR